MVRSFVRLRAERDGRMRLLLLLLLVFSSLGLPAKLARHKYYQTVELPLMVWDQQSSDGAKIAYKHELVNAGGVTIDVQPGWNYSVHPTGNCHDKRIIFVVQLEPKDDDSKNSNAEHRQLAACTVVTTIDDGHVEVWYGLCRGPTPVNERKFDFTLTQMNTLYFTFTDFTMRVYRKDGDDGQDFEMGTVEYVPPPSARENYTAFEEFTAFLYLESCEYVTLKTVFHQDDWRRTKKTVEETNSKETALLTRMTTIFVFITSIACLILSTMYVWSTGVPFFTNRIYDTVFARFSTEATAAHQEEEEAKSCKTAEDQSVDDGGKGEKENIFGDKGRPMRLPNGYTLRDWNAPLDENEEENDGLQTAIDNVEDEKAVPLIPETPPAPTPPAQGDQAENKAPAPDAKPPGGIVV